MAKIELKADPSVTSKGRVIFIRWGERGSGTFLLESPNADDKALGD